MCNPVPLKMDRRLSFVMFLLSLTSLALSTHNGNNINFGEVGGHQPEPTTSSRNHWSPVDPNRLPTDVPQCSLGTLHSNSIPRGQTHVDSIRSIGSHFTIQQCAQRCCQLGSTMCQYAWMFEYRCFAVACPDNPEQCAPTRFPDVDTTFIEISWPGDDQDGAITENELSTENVTMTTTNGAAPRDNSSIATGSTSTMNTQSTTVSMATTAEEDTSPTPPSTHAPSSFPSTTHSPTTHPSTTVTMHSPTTHPSTAHSPTSHPSTTHSPFTTTASEPPTVTRLPSQNTITVAATGNMEVTLPENSVQIFASTWPETRYLGEFTYRWEKLFGPSAGTVNGKNNKDIELTGLEAGVYGLRLTVRSEFGAWGEAAVNVTVHAMPRTNSPPTAVITPMNNITIGLPVDTVILDASSTTDDGGAKALSFHWEEVQGPIRDSTSVSEEAVLELHSLRQGNYRYKLTVTDADGAQSVAFANVTVLPEKDYPPTANAGKSLLIHLPKNEVYLYANSSTDDKGTLHYNWQQLRGQSVDMEGSQTAILHVSQLVVGVYEFELTVSDSAGQSDVASVTVDVQPEKTTPPVANAGGNHTVVFPDDSIMLDGSKSDDDDGSVSTYVWVQISGPTDIHIDGEDSNHLTLQGLHINQQTGSPTLYQFKLTVTNYRNLSDSDIATVSYRKDPHIPPRAAAGPDVTIRLPETTAILDGSQSHDNFGIDSYHWERSSNSPAAGMAVNHSDHQPVLILSNLVNGTYHFVLTITNRNSQKARDNVTLTVLPNSNERDILQVFVEDDPWKFTQEDLHDLGNSLGLMLNNHEEAHKIVFQGVYPAEPNVMVEFYATNQASDQVLNATNVYNKLTAQGQDYYFTRFHIIGVEMKVCQLYCSGHGACNVRTKKCECNNFWMENPFSAHLGRRESNCDWSVFYVVLVALISVLVLVFLVWLCCCCCLRRRRLVRTKRRVRYAILDNKDEESAHMLPKDSSSYQQSSLMVSESDTEEEILFDTAKKGQPAPSSVPTVKNNKLTAGEKYGKNSSLANSVIPK